MSNSFHKKIYVPALIALLIFPFAVFADEDREAIIKRVERSGFFEISQAAVKDGDVKPLLAVIPKELYLGDIAPGDVADGMFSLKSLSGAGLHWFTDGPESWELEENRRLTGSVTAGTDCLYLSVKSIKNGLPEVTDKTKPQLHHIQVTVKAGDESLQFMKELPVGTYREMLKLTYPGGTRTVYFSFKVIDGKPAPQLAIEPPRIDFGIIAPGKQATKQIKITNRGREAAKWRVVIPKAGDEEQNMLPLKGRYVSFLNNDIKGGSIYAPPGHLKDILDVSGKWQEHEGYPLAYGVNNFIKYHFFGTGVGIYLRHGPEGGKIDVYLDDQLISVYDGYALERGSEEFTVADGLPDGPHILAVANNDGCVIIEGVIVYSGELMKGNPGWITVFPDSGATSRETDYVNVRIDARQLNPGCYGEQIVFTSNRGDTSLALSVEVRSDQPARVFDVYRYVRNYDYLFTANPQAEMNKLQSGAYRKEGIAFRLFAPGTPGTTEFYRWYSTKKDDHYYSYDLNGGDKPHKDYLFEGSIGSIGTSKLTNSRELYRWFNPATGRHFYTTDPKGDDIAKKGYEFDGIAGYVK